MEAGDWRENVDQIKRDFLRDGCVIIPGFLSRTGLAELRAHTERCMDERRSGWLGSVRKGLQDVDPWFDEQLRRGQQVGLIETLLDDALEPATAGFFDRLPGETKAILPHFDAIGHRREGATIWIALDSADEANGCLRYVRGTHRLELPSRLDLEFDAQSEGALAVEVNPGDAAIHNSLTVHWSEPNRSDRPRKAISYFYWAASSKGDGKYDDFIQNVKRSKQAMQNKGE